jgi:chromosome segregation ATPase
LEVIELLTGSLESRADDLERELAQLRDRQRELQNTEETQRTQVHDADQQLAGADIDADTRAQLEGIRVQLTGPGLEELKSSQSAVSARQSQIVDSLERVRQRLSSLRQRERDLTGGGASR